MAAIPHFRVGHAAAHDKRELIELVERQSALGCDSLYLYPNATSVVDATKAVTFTWDTKCKVDSEKIDLYVYSTTTASLVKAYTDITFSTGSLTTTLLPMWWNNTASGSLYVNILKSGGMAWDTNWPQGPQFKVEYDPNQVAYTVYTSNGVVTSSAINSGSTDGVFQSVEKTAGNKTSKAVIAVAVVIPIVVVCLLGAVAFYFYRMKEKEKLKRWSQALSQHSNMDWEKGALPGERMSSSYGRPSSSYTRNSTSRARPSTGYGRPSTGYGRPSMSSNRPTSSVMMDNMAGAGVYGTRAFPGSEDQYEGPVRSSVVMPDGQIRQSRISFADGTRPRVSFGHEARPHISSGLANDAAVAASYAAGSAIDDRELTLSPSQADGPGGVDDGLYRAASGTHTGQVDRSLHPNALDHANALHTSGSADELRDMESVTLAHTSRMEDHVEAMEHSEHAPNSVPNVAYGPDQMLAVYAARGKVNASPVNTPNIPEGATPPPPSAKAASTMRRFLSRKDKDRIGGNPRDLASPSPEPMPAMPEPKSMRSYVHLNNGTASAKVIDSLPPPGPPRPGSSQSQVLSDEHHQ